MKTMVDYVDEMREIELWEKVSLDFEGLFLAGTGKVDLEGVEGIVLAA